MAIIYSYPIINTVQNADMFVISKSPTDPAVDEWETKSLTANTLASYVTARVNLNFLGDTGTGVVNLDTQNLTISGTSNEIETLASSQTLQIGLPDSVTITSNLAVGVGLANGNLTVGGPSSQSQIAGYLDLTEVFVNDTLEVDGDTTLNNDLDVSGNAQIGGSLNMSLSRINNVSNPTLAQDAATKAYVDALISGGLSFRGSFRADTGEILSGINTGSYLYNCPGGAGTRVSLVTGDYYIVANTGGQFYCSGDLLNVGDSIMAVADAAADSSTVNDWATLESDNIEGTGLANTVPLWTDSQVLGNSNITQSLGGSIVISENLLVDQKEIEASTMIINGVAEITGELDKAGSKIIGLADPTAAQDAATKAYVDAVDLDFTGNSGTGNVQQGSTFNVLGSGPITTSASGTTLTINSSAAEGTGATNYIVRFTDGPNGVIGDSGIVDNGNVIQLDSSRNFNITRTFGNNNIQSRILVGAGVAAGDLALDVKQKAYVRAGLVVSPNPGGVQVDDSSLVVGAGNNDIVSGSDHCLTVGNGNQIISDSDRSVSFGNNNETKQSDNSMNVGNTNLLKYSNNSHIIGQNNKMGDDFQSGTAGFNNSLVIGSDNLLSTDDGSPNPPDGGLSFVIGHDNDLKHTQTNSFTFGYSIANLGGSATSHRNDFNIGGDLTAVNQTMTLGYRNDTTLYPTIDRNNGLGETKFVVAVGSLTNSNANALLITEGGITAGGGGIVPQIPRVILPTVPTFSASNDAAADAIGVPEGALYQNNGVVQVNRGGGSTTDPLDSGGATSLDGLTDVLTTTDSAYFLDPPSSSWGVDNIVLGFNAASTEPRNNNIIIGNDGGNIGPNADDAIIIGHNAAQNANAFAGGTRCVVIGNGAMQDINWSVNNTVVGYEAAKRGFNGGNGTGYNICIGAGSGPGGSGQGATGSANYAIGTGLFNLTSGSNNVSVGNQAGQSTTTGFNNTFLGHFSNFPSSGAVGTGGNNTIVGYNAKASSDTVSNEITLGNSSVTVLRCAVTSITSLSDERDKKDITDLQYGLDFIESLQPKQFTWDNRTETFETTDLEGNNITEEVISSNKGKKDFGFIAQDVQALDNDIIRLVYDENPDKLEMSYGKLVPILVKAVKELSDKVKALENA